jgi:hypothetical protein
MPILLPEGQAGEAWEASNKAVLFLKWGSFRHKSTFFGIKVLYFALKVLSLA